MDEDKINSKEMKFFIEKNKLNVYRYIAVYDMRDIRGSSNNTLDDE